MAEPTAVVPASGPRAFEAYLPRKVVWRLIPFLGLLYIANSIDRSNVGFARLTMQRDLGMSDAVFDLGFGIFYFGYLTFEVPANLLLRRVGARRWIARIMITWGLASCLTMAVKGTGSFYAVRILLGVAEAGFFPGIVLYLTYWFPARERARVIALFMAAIPVADIVGNLLSGEIMHRMGGVAGLRDWQWLFLLEGIPSVLLGFWVLASLPDGPAQARWLSPDERDWLSERVRGEEAYRMERHGGDMLRAFASPRVWLLIGLYFTVAAGANAAGAWFPKLLSQQFPGYDKSAISRLAAATSLCAVVAMLAIGARSDRTGERRGHVAFAALLASAGWALAAMASSGVAGLGSPWLVLAGLCLARAGMMSMLPPFWAIPTAFLSGAAAAGGIALINSVGNVGGLMGPSILGRFGLAAMAVMLAVGAALALCVRYDATLDRGLPGAGGPAADEPSN